MVLAICLRSVFLGCSGAGIWLHVSMLWALCTLPSLSGCTGHSGWCLRTICGTSLGLQSLLGLEDRAVAYGEISMEEIRHASGCGPEVNGQRHAFIGFGFSDRIFGNPGTWSIIDHSLNSILMKD